MRLTIDIINLDPPFLPGTSEEIVDFGIFEGLITYKPGTWEVVNQLAETFEPSADGLQFAFKLKEGIQFHGGYGELTAEDVKFSYERTAGLTTAGDRLAVQGRLVARAAGGQGRRHVLGHDHPQGAVLRAHGDDAARLLRLGRLEEGGRGAGRGLRDESDRHRPVRVRRVEAEAAGDAAAVRRLRRRVVGLPRDARGTRSIFIPIEEDNAASIALETGEVDFGELAAQRDQPLRGERRLHGRRRATSVDYDWIGMNMLNPKLAGHQRAPGDPLCDRRAVHPRGRLRGPVRARDRDPAARHADRLLGGRAAVRARHRRGEGPSRTGEQPADGARVSSTPRRPARRRPPRSSRRTSPRSASTSHPSSSTRRPTSPSTRRSSRAASSSTSASSRTRIPRGRPCGSSATRSTSGTGCTGATRSTTGSTTRRSRRATRPCATTCTSRCSSSGTRRRTRSGSRWPTSYFARAAGHRACRSRPDGRILPTAFPRRVASCETPGA